VGGEKKKKTPPHPCNMQTTSVSFFLPGFVVVSDDKWIKAVQLCHDKRRKI
jgi:hypothetical protein